jgi:omega-6 fatty acid desaturase (delta-12 desaturase)
MLETPPRAGKALIDASRVFAREDRARSWFHVATTLAALGGCAALAAMAPWWPLQAFAAIVEALVLLRAFTLYHDHMHGALLRDSRFGALLLRAAGVLMLTPPQIWADTHNVHHANTARPTAPATGTYSLWTVARWDNASRGERLRYRLERSALTMLLGYFTVFLGAMCLLPPLSHPRRYASSAVALILHLAISVSIWSAFGFAVYAATILAPFAVSCAIGSYLFYAQHNAPGIELRSESRWTHDEAALRGSTHLVTGPLMRWFTGNIGLHHVHHLNARIPFYRLPEAMAALPELQDPIVTTLGRRDILACLRLALWEQATNRMIAVSEVGEIAQPMVAPAISSPPARPVGT